MPRVSIQKLVLLLFAIVVTAMVISRLITSTWLPAAELAPRYLWIIWINFLIELFMLVVGVYFVYRFVLTDREFRQHQSRVKHLADMALMSGGLVHEARNHIHAMKPHLALIKKRAGDAEKVVSRVSKLETVADDLEQLLNEFLIFARPASDNSENVNLVELISELVESIRNELQANQILLHFEHDAKTTCLIADRLKLRGAILNLVLNSAQAIESNGNIWIILNKRQNEIIIQVKDDGSGISQEDQQKIFHSFFTTKAEGTGLGLAIVQRTIQDMNGTITVDSEVDNGTTFTIKIPANK